MATLLYNRSVYSLLESTLTIEQLVGFAKEHGYQSVGLCDTGNFFAAMLFYDACQTNGIKPVIGVEVKVNIEDYRYPFLLYPLNNDGYREAAKLTADLLRESDAISYQQLQDLSDNIAVIIPEEDGYLAHFFNHNQADRIIQIVNDLPANYYLAVGSNTSAFNRSYNAIIKEAGKKSKHRTIALKLARFGSQDDLEALKVLQAIKYGTTILDERIRGMQAQDELISPTGLMEQFDLEDLNNSDELASRIQLDFSRFHTTLPHYDNGTAVDNKEYLRQLCMGGLKKRLNGNVSAEYVRRLNYELGIITSKHFEDYFLIIYDIVLHARKENINIGPGRGSAVGSLAAYCLGITHVDPIQYGLLFERFLNPERIKMPDIDIDIPDEYRSEMIRYVREKYGNDHVCNIITFNSLAARAVLRDAGKAMNLANHEIDLLTNMIERRPDASLGRTYDGNANFARAVNASDKYRQLYQIARKLEGLPRNISTHASGIIISADPLEKVIPVLNTNETLLSQYEMQHLEQFGLIKFDFLGLRNLATIEQIYHSIRPNGNCLDILKMPLNDAKTFELLRRVDTEGIFQLEKSAMKIVTKKIQPTTFEDIPVIMALGRPGSSQFIDQYVINRQHPENISYLHPDFMPILKNTYGIIIYQEQVMQIAQKIAGFSLGKANTLREAVSKKKASQVEALKNDYIQGALGQGYSATVAEQSYQLILKFADYGFNKSHAVAYSLIAYQLAYFKANEPLHFYRAILNGVLGNMEKTNSYIQECRLRKITILSPDINRSTDEFMIENGAIRFPLNAIKSVSSMDTAKILKDRQENGSYDEFYKAAIRLRHIGLGKKTIEALIHGGALDAFNLTHTTMINGLDSTLTYGDMCLVEQNGQTSLDLNLLSDAPVLTNYADSRDELLDQQYEYLGVYLSSLPTEQYRSQYPSVTVAQVGNRRGEVTMILMVKAIKQHRTRKDELMAFVTAQDETGSIDLVLFANIYRKYDNLLKKGIIILINGEKGERDSVKVNSITLLKG